MLKDAAQGYIDVVGIENIPFFSSKVIKEERESPCFSDRRLPLVVKSAAS